MRQRLQGARLTRGSTARPSGEALCVMVNILWDLCPSCGDDGEMCMSGEGACGPGMYKGWGVRVCFCVWGGGGGKGDRERQRKKEIEKKRYTERHTKILKCTHGRRHTCTKRPRHRKTD